jgi:ubiquinone/menaquinone biosynthesis C-methylase UbiE
MYTETAELYDAIYAFKDYRTEARQLATLIREGPPGARSVLDVACGTGEHARWLTVDHGFSVDGVDLDEALLAVARRKVPDGRFVRADMEDFDLGRQYDAVLCLFSSIGYLVTLERVGHALDCFRRHVAPDGVVVVEPWFEPGVIDPTRISRHTGTLAAGRVERVSQIDVDDRVSRIHFGYTIETDAGAHEAAEVHELGLFTTGEMQQAFEAAGFTATFDFPGLMGRGLWVARPAR